MTADQCPGLRRLEKYATRVGGAQNQVTKRGLFTRDVNRLRLMLGTRLSPAWRIGLWMLVGVKLMLPAFIPAFTAPAAIAKLGADSEARSE